MNTGELNDSHSSDAQPTFRSPSFIEIDTLEIRRDQDGS